MPNAAITPQAVERALAGERVIFPLGDGRAVRIMKVSDTLHLTTVMERRILSSKDTPAERAAEPSPR